MKARFIGDPNNDGDGPRVLAMFDHRFPKDRFVNVTDAVGEKLKTNNHFQVEDGALSADEAEDVAGLVEDLSQRAPAPKTAPDKPGMSKAAITARLDALRVEYDPKLGAPKLAAILEEAEFEAGDED